MVSAVSRHPDKLDIFVVGTDGGVWTAAWEGKTPATQWEGWWPIPGVQAKVGSPVGAVARSEMLDIFVVDTGGEIRHASWVAGHPSWLGWLSVAGGRAAPGSLVTAVSRRPDLLDAFVVGTDGRVFTAAWQAKITGPNWQGWWPIGDHLVGSGRDVGVVARTLS